MKRCRKCGLNKSTTPGKEEFYKDPTAKDGLQEACKWCVIEDGKERYRRKKLNEKKNAGTLPSL